MKDFYQILGVSKNSTTDEIKTAYRKLATKFHPDKNGDDKYFEERFKEIQVAYDTLDDNYSRSEYDRKLNDYHNSRNSQQTNYSSAAPNSSKDYQKDNRKNYSSNKSENAQVSAKKNYGCGKFILIIVSFSFFWFLWKQCSANDVVNVNTNLLNDSAAILIDSASSDIENNNNKILPIAGVVSSNNNTSKANKTKKTNTNLSNKKTNYSTTAKTSYKNNKSKRASKIRNSSSSYQSTSGYCGHPNKTGGNCKRRVKGGGFCWQHS